MGTKYLEMTYQSHYCAGDLRQIAMSAFAPLNGAGEYTSNGFILREGKFGINFQSLVKLTATIIFHKIKDNYFTIQVYLQWSGSSLTWLICILGLLTGGIPLIVLILYLLFDPVPAYQQALLRVRSSLQPETIRIG